MSNCAVEIIDGGTITNSKIIAGEIVNSILINATLHGGVNLDRATAISIVNQICGEMQQCVRGHVSGGAYSDVTLVASTINNSRVSNGELVHGVTADLSATEDLTNILRANINTIARDAIADALKETLYKLELDTPNIVSNLKMDEGAKDAAVALLHAKMMAALTPSITSMITTAIEAITEGGTLNDSNLVRPNGTGGTLTATTLVTSNISQPIFDGAISMDDAARASFCDNLRACIISVVHDEVWCILRDNVGRLIGDYVQNVRFSDTTGELMIDRVLADGSRETVKHKIR